MLTVTKVSITTDMAYAHVYLSVFGPEQENKKKVVEEVNGMSRNIRRLLGDRVRFQLRVIPELQFFEDDSLDYIAKIDDLLKQ